MSLAWGGIVLLVLLLPGVLFFIGLYIPEKFTRDTAERSAISQLAGVVLISFVVHGFLFLLLSTICGDRIPCINLEQVLAAISLGNIDGTTPASVAVNLTTYKGSIFLYIMSASALGLFAGNKTGKLIVKGPLRFLAQHTWIYDLTVNHEESLTVAYVMTNVRHNEKILVYRGFLHTFGLQKDGKFSYLVLSDVVRYYMLLKEDTPITVDRKHWRQIGKDAAHLASAPSSPLGQSSRHRETSYMVIEGEDVANVVFDRYGIMGRIPTNEAELSELINRLTKEYLRAIS